MGPMDGSLEWHSAYPVDNHVLRRNTIVYLLQKNQNPFVIIGTGRSCASH